MEKNPQNLAGVELKSLFIWPRNMVLDPFFLLLEGEIDVTGDVGQLGAVEASGDLVSTASVDLDLHRVFPETIGGNVPV